MCRLRLYLYMKTPNRNGYRAARRDTGLAGEHPFTDVGQLILFSLLAGAWVSDSFLFRYSLFQALRVPAYVRVPAGVALLCASILLVFSAHNAVFGKAKRPAGGKIPLQTTGVFGLVRHPMYFGSWLFSFGLAITTLSLSSLAVSLVILIFYCVVSRHEERLLLGRYGTEYREYQARGLLAPAPEQVFPVAPDRLGLFRRDARWKGRGLRLRELDEDFGRSADDLSQQLRGHPLSPQNGEIPALILERSGEEL